MRYWGLSLVAFIGLLVAITGAILGWVVFPNIIHDRIIEVRRFW